MRRSCLLFVIILVFISVSAQAVEYKIQSLAPEDKSAQNSWACSINDKGQVLGRLGRDVVIWNIGGEMQRICSPIEDCNINPCDINNNGLVAGVYQHKRSTGTTSYVFENKLVTIPGVDVMKIQDVPFSLDAGASAAINDNGWIAFTALSEEQKIRGYVVKGDNVVTDNKLVSRPLAINNKGHIAGFSGGRVIIADTEGKAIRNADNLPGYHNSYLTTAINEHDEAVGYVSDDKYSPHAFVFRRDSKELNELSRPDGYESAMANEINNSGLVVGYVGNYQNQKAVAWDAQNRIIELPTLPNCRVSEARGVNDAGQIVGVCSGKAVLWIPIKN